MIYSTLTIALLLLISSTVGQYYSYNPFRDHAASSSLTMSMTSPFRAEGGGGNFHDDYLRLDQPHPVNVTYQYRQGPIGLGDSPPEEAAISLAIVFDSTGSMGNDLKQVKIGSRRILQKHLQRGEANYIRDFVLVKVHDPDVGPARVTTSTKTFYQYLDSVYTQGGGDCPEMTITGIELALEASRPNSLIYVFTDSSAKDYNKTNDVLNLIQKKQSQVVFVLTGFCNTTDEPGFEAYRQIATVSSGQLYIIGKGQVNEFMQVVEAAVESRKVHLLQEDTSKVESKTYSFPVDSHLKQLTIQVTNDLPSQEIDVKIRNPEGKLIGSNDGLRRLMKAVSSVFVGSIDHPQAGRWTIEVTTESTDDEDGHQIGPDERSFSVRVSGISDVDFLQGFSATCNAYNYAASQQPIAGVKNYVMVNMTGRFLPGKIEHFYMRATNGTSMARIPVKQTEQLQIYIGEHQLDPLVGHYYLEVSGHDNQGFPIQRYSKVALSVRPARPIVVSCPAKLELQRGATSQLSCSVASEVPYVVYWYKDDQQLTGWTDENKIFNHPADVTYTISDANEDSHGIYAVEVKPTIIRKEQSDIEGQYRDEVSVIILPPPPRVLIARNSSVEPGSDAVLKCNIFTLDESVTVKWYRGLEPRFQLTDNRRHKIAVTRTSVPGGPAQVIESQLLIRDASNSDAGKYICEAGHKGGISEADGFLHIHVLPKVTVTTDHVTFKENSTLILTCQAEGVPPPEIVWMFNNMPVTPTSELGERATIRQEYFESQLIIRPTKSTDMGKYTCMAVNSAGNQSALIVADFISQPTIDKLDVLQTGPVIGQSQTFICRVSGKPKPQIKWEFNGSPVSSNANIRIDEESGTLEIVNVELQMKGDWACIAESIAGSTRQAVKMDVGYPPQILTELTTSQVVAEFAQDTTLVCPVEGQPTPTVKWYRATPGGHIPIQFDERHVLQVDNSLLIRSVNIEDEGAFMCQAVNMYGRANHTVEVKIGGTKAPMISFTQPKQVAVIGDPEKRLVCNVMDAKPTPTVAWMVNNRPIDFEAESDKYRLSKHDLLIYGIESPDEGIYTCIARNVVGKVTFDIELDVQNKPSFTRTDQPTSISVVYGDVLELNCLVEGDPKPTVEWRKDGRRILLQGRSNLPGAPSGGDQSGDLTSASGSMFVISPDGYKLTVYSVGESVAGTYSCSAVNAHAAITREFQVSVKIPPSIGKEGNSDFELGQNEVGLLKCTVGSSQPPAKISWFKNGQPLKPVPGRVSLLDGGYTLEIHGKEESDSGSYECRAENEAGMDSRFYQVTVLVPPVVMHGLDKYVRRLVTPGSRVNLPCSMSGFPEPSLTWNWGGRSLSVGGGSHDPAMTAASSLGIDLIKQTPEQVDLVIQSMTGQLQGNYTCIGENKGGTTEINYELVMLEQPKIEGFMEKAVVFVNNTITLTCEASGSPPPNISWQFKGQPLIPEHTDGYRWVGPANLMLLSARPYQGGEYTCMAENEAGVDRASMTLTVFEPSESRGVFKNVTIKQATSGGNITFTCIMSSNPPAKIQWYKDEKDIFSVLPRERFTISEDGSALTLFNVDSKDQGQFKCLAVNIPGSWKYQYTLEVTSSPGILRHSSSKTSVHVSEGQELRLQCLAIANPDPEYQWLKDGNPVSMGVMIDPLMTSRHFNMTPVSPNGGGPLGGSRIALMDQGRILVVHNIQSYEAGVYTCIAKNPVGKDVLDINVTVSSQPTFADGKDHETPSWERNKPAELWCNVTGFPEPEITWDYEIPVTGSGSRDVEVGFNGRLLYVPNVDDSVVTRYICTARNKAGSVRRVFDPTLVYAPKITALEGKNPRPVLLNTSTRFFCDWEAAPSAEVSWYKDGELIETTSSSSTSSTSLSRATLSNRGTQLFLFDIQPEDAGNYRCVVTNDYGSTKRQWAVEVMSPPSIRFSSPEGEQSVSLGTSLALFCVTNGNPPPRIEWTRDGKPIDGNDGRFEISPDTVHLRLAEIDQSDAGRYACKVTSDYGQISRNFDVKVTYGPRLESEGQLQYSLERTVGSSMLLECLVTGSPTPTIKWYKDGQPLTQMPYRYRLINQDRQMEIVSIQPSDAGRYKCLATNAYGQLSITSDVAVGAPARIDRGRIRTEYKVREGDELVLPCPATGSPAPKIQFTRTSSAGGGGGGGDEDNWLRHSAVSQEHQTLTLYRTSKADSGTYQCNASNAVGWDLMEYFVRIKVPPTFDTSNVQPEVHWFVNQTRSLDCTLMEGADPPPQIKWQHHGAPIVTSATIQVSPDGSRITVPTVSTNDAGEYICEAQNEVGKSTQVFNVFVYVRPRFLDPTKRLHIQAVQNETIQLVCEASGDPRPRFAWFKRDLEILQSSMGQHHRPHGSGDPGQSSIAVLSGDQLLQIANIQTSDSGEYACTASNGGGTIEKKFNVTVIVPPVIVKRSDASEEHRTREHVPVTFYCLVRNYNQTRPEISWTKDGSPVLMSPSGDYFVIQDEGQSLTVVRPTASEAGQYRCLARNKAGEDRHSFQLEVTVAPRFPSDFVRFRESLVARLGSSIELSCPVDGSPDPVIQWYVNGNPLRSLLDASVDRQPYHAFDVNSVVETSSPAMNRHVYVQQGRQLKLLAVAGSDAGTYQCLARNEAGNVSKIYELEVVMPPLVRLDKADVREREGATFTIHCSAQGHPKPTLEWSRETGGLFRYGTRIDVVTGLLTITEASKEDSGHYTCTATNKISRDSKSVSVEIIERPTIHTSLEPIMVQEGSQVLLPCHATGTQPIRIQWLLPSGQLLTATDHPGHFRILPDQGLLIDQVKPEHSGRYRCSANNEAGFQNAVISLEVLVPPKLVRPASTEIAGRLNSVLQLHCQVESGTPTPSIAWERNGLTFSRTKSYYTTTESGLFIFNSLKQEDAGDLTCIAKNPAGEDRLTYRISVQVPPRVSLPISTIGNEDQSVKMTCDVQGQPKPEVVWEFKGQPLTSQLGNRVHFESSTALTIYNLKPSDSGSYFCIARSAGQEIAMESTFLTVFTKPRFEFTPNKTTEAYESRWIQFRCQASGHPKPSIQWMYNNDLLPSNPSKNGIGHLVLGPLRTEQAGHYRCLAQNDVGKDEYSFQLVVKTRPKVHVYQSDDPDQLMFGRRDRHHQQFFDRRLRCDVDGEADSVVWLKDGDVVANSSRIDIVDSGQSLIIRMAKSHDTGLYQCVASNPVGEDFGELRLVIESKPQLITVPRNMTVTVGSLVTMECLAEGEPRPIITWYKDNQLLTMNAVRSIINNGSLRFISVSPKDDGAYHCVASSNLGEDFSPMAMLRVQLDGGWAQWSEWSQCSESCGHGMQTRTRACTDPEPRYGGRHCQAVGGGESSQSRRCLTTFCPSDGQWSQWTPWSSCSASCGSGLSRRQRQCDSPPPSNGGKTCPGEAVEDILCEDLPACPVSGSWSPWSQWTECSDECGSSGTQSRRRECNNPAPSNGGRKCPGKEFVVRACNRRPCPIDGAWGSWGPWSHCSRSCGGGQRQRVRRCDSPSAQYGGRDCQVDGRSEVADCQEEPCPIHGEWSNWSSWSGCSRTCGQGLASRERNCHQPLYGGRLCPGQAKQVRVCDTGRTCQPSPNNYRLVEASRWTPWSEWSECQPDCSSSSSIAPSRRHGWRQRWRSCQQQVAASDGDDYYSSSAIVVDGKMIASQVCQGPSEESLSCELDPSSFDWTGACLDSVTRPILNGYVHGVIRGALDGIDLGLLPFNASWLARSNDRDGLAPTQFEFHISRIPKELAPCLSLLTELYSPTLWYAAKQVSGTLNGQVVVGPDSGFNWHAKAQFADGSEISIRHQIGRPSLSGENDSQGQIELDSYVTGSCPVSLTRHGDELRVGDLKVYDFVENVVQLNPNKGQLHVDSTRTFAVRRPPSTSFTDGQYEDDFVSEPYSWTSLIDLGSGGKRRQAYLSQILNVDRLRIDDMGQSALRVFADATINAPLGGDTCPNGFEIRRLTGPSASDYCEDVNECASPALNRCDHVCSNTLSRYVCSCRPGYRLGPDGHSCLDIDECADKGCPANQQCVNTPGSFECRPECGQGLTESQSGQCEDIDECRSVPGLCGSHECVNTYGSYYCACSPGFMRHGDGCQDIDECAMGTHTCEANDQCVNTIGSFRCLSACPDGYRATATTLGRDGQTKIECTDIDECSLLNRGELTNRRTGSPLRCPLGSRCVNEPGTYSCQCPDGRQAPLTGCGDGAPSRVICDRGFQWDEDRGCVDVNECESGGHPVCQHKCFNTYGSYRCMCPRGYKLDKRTNLCKDINECEAAKSPCGQEQICLNSQGNYTCVQKNCPKGYTFDRSGRSCRLLCSTTSELACPQGAKYADTVEYLMVSLAPPGSGDRASGTRVMLRVVDWNQSHDTGLYQCVASNPVGEDFGELRLVIESKPQLITVPRNMTVTVGSLVTMECLAEGEPRPIITWYKDNQLLTMNAVRSIINNGSLRFISVSPKDDGAYHCVASSNLGEDFSPMAMLRVQLDGGWAQWSEWSQCSESCGHGMQTRTRACTDPEPRYGGRHCQAVGGGESSQSRRCLTTFCPSDGQWSQWTPWSSCSASCGYGLSRRQRQCDSPPPSNGGKTCPGEAVEDILCEDLPACPVSGSWSPWSQWTECSDECGSSGTQSRRRECNNPAPSNGGRKCPGKEFVVRACNRRPCPIDGAWGSWGPWSHCSRSCGGGQRQRVRRCDSPSAQYGGRDCPVDGRSEVADCQEEPCPIHGEWSNWSSWSGCSRTCGQGLASRERNCHQPLYGGRLCPGQAKQVRVCDTGRTCQPSPNNYRLVEASRWTPWSEWSECQPDCSSSSSIAPSRRHGWRQRWRSCQQQVAASNGDDYYSSSAIVVDGKMIASQVCQGPSEESLSCELDPSSFDWTGACLDSVTRPILNGYVHGVIRGALDGIDLGLLPFNASWLARSNDRDGLAPTQFEFHISRIPKELAPCLSLLTELYSPTLWYAAKQVSGTLNGQVVVGSDSGFNWHAKAQFADGSEVSIRHQIGRPSLSGENDSQGQIELDSYVTGSCPVSLTRHGDELRVGDLKVYDFVENVVQLNPNKGQLHVDSTRTFAVRRPPSTSFTDGQYEDDFVSEPYSWTSLIDLGSGGKRRQAYLSQILNVDRLRIDDMGQSALRVFADATINAPLGGDTCPNGFEIRRLTGPSASDYCEDVNECASPALNRCDHVCSNILSRYVCSCRPGYRLGPDGHSCLDIDECADKGCPANQQCVNTPGSFECRPECGQGLTESQSGQCEDIDECRSVPGLCGSHECVNTYGSYYCACSPGFMRHGDGCQDIDECAMGTHTCEANDQCVNTIGSFRCLSACPDGYRATATTLGRDGQTKIECTDIDECSLLNRGELTNRRTGSPLRCPLGSRCVNEPGTYSCQCPDGRQAPLTGCGDGAPSRVICDRGFQWDEDRGCVDVNECESGGHPVCQHKCFNTYGSYRCMCPRGYKLDKRTNLCKDINECEAAKSPCGQEQICLNSQGNYTCVQKNCPKGYTFDRSGRSCRLLCSTTSELACPQGAKYADTVEYLMVSLAPPGSGDRASGTRVMLRVVDWNQVQQSNCRYNLLDQSAFTPVDYYSDKGVVYLTPSWVNSTTAAAHPDNLLLTAQLRSASSKIDRVEPGNLYYLYFRVSCYASSDNQRRDDYETRVEGDRLVFQHSFYVYIAIARYPF